MIRYLSHDAIDKSWWDAQLMQCPDRLWYMQSWVLDLCCPAWEALIHSDGAIMPLLHRRKWGQRYLFQPFGMQELGVFAPMRTPGLDDAFLAAIPAHFKFWDLWLNRAMQVHAHRGDRLMPQVNMELPLLKEATTLRDNYGRGHKRNLKKAGVDPPVITTAVGAQEFVTLFDRTTGRRFGPVPEGGLLLLERLIHGARERGQCELYGVRNGNALIAAICFMVWEGRIILLKSAMEREAADRYAMFHLVDHAIARYAGSNMLLDFAGSNTSSVARFYEGFGAQRAIYLRLIRNRLPIPFRWLK